MEMLSSFRGDKHEFCLVVIKFKHVRRNHDHCRYEKQWSMITRKMPMKCLLQSIGRIRYSQYPTTNSSITIQVIVNTFGKNIDSLAFNESSIQTSEFKRVIITLPQNMLAIHHFVTSNLTYPLLEYHEFWQLSLDTIHGQQNEHLDCHQCEFEEC